MKKFLSLLWLFALFGAAQAQTSYTPNRNLTLPPAAPGTWGEQYNNNFQELDISKIPRVTIATLPGNPELNTVVVVTDAANGSTCATGGGTSQNTCQWDGSVWTVVGGGGGTGSASVFDSSVAFTAEITPAQIVANTNDYNPTGLSTASTLRLATDASRDLTGIAGGADGRLLILHNVGAQNIVLKNLTTSAAANQFSINADITLAPNLAIILQYDATSSKWRAASGVSGGAGQAADNDLTALAALGSTGIAARTGTDTWAQRTITSANASNIGITNGTGVSGDPTIDVGANVVLTSRSNTITAGDFDLGTATSFTFPKAPNAAPSAEGRCAQDTTAHRLKCNFGSGVVILAMLSEVQTLNANLTGLAGVTPSTAGVPYFTGSASAMSAAVFPSCPDSAGQHLNVLSTSPLTIGCGASSASGLSGLTTNKFLFATSATGADTSGNLSQAGGVVNASGGLTVGDVATNYIALDPAAVTGAKTWTAQNTSGLIIPCDTTIGNYTNDHIIKVVKVGSIVTCADGGAPGTGTWTDASSNTGSNKTLDDATNTLKLTKSVQVELFGPTTDTASGNGQYYFRVPASLNGTNLTGVQSNTVTAGTTGLTSAQITKCAAVATSPLCSGTTVSMLSTVVSIDSGETSSSTAATAAVISVTAGVKAVATGDILRFDVTAIHTTPAKGLLVNLDFKLP